MLNTRIGEGVFLFLVWNWTCRNQERSALANIRRHKSLVFRTLLVVVSLPLQDTQKNIDFWFKSSPAESYVRPLQHNFHTPETHLNTDIYSCWHPKWKVFQVGRAAVSLTFQGSAKWNHKQNKTCLPQRRTLSCFRAVSGVWLSAVWKKTFFNLLSFSTFVLRTIWQLFQLRSAVMRPTWRRFCLCLGQIVMWVKWIPQINLEAGSALQVTKCLCKWDLVFTSWSSMR